PATYDAVWAISNLDHAGAGVQLHATSNRGPEVAFTAPGSDALLVDPDQVAGGATDGVCPYLGAGGPVCPDMASLLFITTGPSYSSPLVAALAALVISENPSLAPPGQSWGPGAVEWVLRASSVDLRAVGHDNDFGWGLPRADVAVSIAAALA